MTIENPKRSDANTAPLLRKPDQPDELAVQVKDVGVGAIKAYNPFDNWLPSFDTPEAYDEAVPPKAAPTAKGGVGAAGGGAVGAGAGAKGQAAKLLERARSFIGTPYKWGGTGPLGFDCSGFTQYLFKELGINLPRVSAQQGTYGQRVSIDKLRPGDLVFWDNSSRNNGADHVAIYLGNGQVIHAPKPGDSVKISSIWDSGRAWGVAMNL